MGAWGSGARGRIGHGAAAAATSPSGQAKLGADQGRDSRADILRDVISGLVMDEAERLHSARPPSSGGRSPPGERGLYLEELEEREAKLHRQRVGRQRRSAGLRSTSHDAEADPWGEAQARQEGGPAAQAAPATGAERGGSSTLSLGALGIEGRLLRSLGAPAAGWK